MNQTLINRTLLFAICAVLSAQALYGQDVVLRTQTDVDAFRQTVVLGDLLIESDSLNDPIYHLDSLYRLVRVEGSLTIRDNEFIEDVDGLAHLSTIRDALFVDDNQSLISLSGFGNIRDIIGVMIWGNPLLEDLDAFHHVTSLLVLWVMDNSSLKCLSGFTNLNVVSFYCLISRNPSLYSLEGLSSLRYFQSFSCNDNPSLSDCCVLEWIAEHHPVFGEINLSGNATGCNSIEEILDYPCPMDISVTSSSSCLDEMLWQLSIRILKTDANQFNYWWYRHEDGARGQGSASSNPILLDGMLPGTYDVGVATSMPLDTAIKRYQEVGPSGTPQADLEEVIITNAVNGRSNGSIELRWSEDVGPYNVKWQGGSDEGQIFTVENHSTIPSLAPGTYVIQLYEHLTLRRELTVEVGNETLLDSFCNQPLDIVILNDVSRSVSAIEYAQSKEFFVNLLQRMDISADSTGNRAVIVEWCHSYQQAVMIPLTDDIAVLEAYSEANRAFEDDATAALAALEFGYDYLTLHARPGAEKVIILSTDGKRRQIGQALVARAEEIKAAGFHIVTIAFDRAYTDPFARDLLRRAASVNVLAPGAASYAELNGDLAQDIIDNYLCPIPPGSSMSLSLERDGHITIDSIAHVDCTYPVTADITFTILSYQEYSLPAGTYVSFYDQHPLQVGAQRLSSWRMPCELSPGDQATFSTTITLAHPTSLYAVLNDDGSQSTPFIWPVTDVLEVSYENNIDVLNLCTGGQAIIQAFKRALHRSSRCDSTVTYVIDVCNIGDTMATGVQVIDEAAEGFDLIHTRVESVACAVVNEALMFDLDPGCCITVSLTYDVSAALPGEYDDQDVRLEGPPYQEYIGYEGRLNAVEDVAIFFESNCDDADIGFVKEVSDTAICSESVLTYTFIIENRGHDTLHDIIMKDVLPAEANWSFRPYEVEGLTVDEYVVEGNFLQVAVGHIPPLQTGQFLMDVTVYDWSVQDTLFNVATLEGIPHPYLDISTEISSGRTATLIQVAPSVQLASDQVTVANQEVEVQLDAAVQHADQLTWRSDGYGFFDRPNAAQTTYTFSAEEMSDSLIYLYLEASNACGTTEKMLTIKRTPFDCTESIVHSIQAESDTIIFEGASVQLSSSVINPSSRVTWAWNPTSWLSCIACDLPIANPQASTIYTVQVTDEYGCQAEAQVIVEVISGVQIFIPTAFSPNHDGINDLFRPFHSSDYAFGYHIVVYNRWGGKVYSGDSRNGLMGWDGRTDDREQPEGTYLYQIDLYEGSHTIARRSGEVMLLR